MIGLQGRADENQYARRQQIETDIENIFCT
jgi:hypothetical protein